MRSIHGFIDLVRIYRPRTKSKVDILSYKTMYWPISKGYNCFMIIIWKLILFKSINVKYLLQNLDVEFILWHHNVAMPKLIIYFLFSIFSEVYNRIAAHSHNSNRPVMRLEKYDIIIKYDMIYMRWMFNSRNYHKLVYLCANKFSYRASARYSICMVAAMRTHLSKNHYSLLK